MSDQPELGKLRKGGEDRDAVHVAIVPLVCGEDYMMLHQRFKLKYGTKDVAIGVNYDREGQALGIIDPFLEKPLRKGDLFWGFLFPGTITGLRHHWSHPVFDLEPKQPKDEHEKWLRRFCERWGFEWDELINVTRFPCADTWVTAWGVDLHDASELGEDHELFWHHLEKFTGETFNKEHREKVFWSCSC